MKSLINPRFRCSIIYVSDIGSRSIMREPTIRARSSVGRAPRSQRGGRGFEPLRVHQKPKAGHEACFGFFDMKQGVRTREGASVNGKAPVEPWQRAVRRRACESRKKPASRGPERPCEAGGEPLRVHQNEKRVSRPFLFFQNIPHNFDTSCSHILIIYPFCL